MKNNITLTSLCQPIVISALLFSPQLTFAQTLTEAIEQTIKTNPEVLEEAYRKLASDSTIAQAQAGYYPKIDLAVGTGWESTDSPTTRANGSHKNKHLNRDEASLNLSQMLFDGFAVKSQVDRSQSLVESAAYQVANSSERLSLRAINVYLATLQDRELLEITQGNFDAHEQTHDQITLRSESGVGSKADIDQSQGRLSLAQANLLAAHGNLEDSQSNFQRVVGNLPEELEMPASLCCDIFPATVEDAIQITFDNHPSFYSSIAGYEAELAQIQGAKARLSPRLDFELGTTANNNLDGVKGHNNDVTAMLRLRYNVYNGGADHARIAETEFLSLKEEQVTLGVKRDIEESTRLSWNAYVTAKEVLPNLKLHAESAEKARHAYAQQFRLGQRTLLDMLDSENELFTARSDYISGQYNVRLAGYKLITAMGQLLDTVEVAPREESIPQK